MGCSAGSLTETSYDAHVVHRQHSASHPPVASPKGVRLDYPQPVAAAMIVEDNLTSSRGSRAAEISVRIFCRQTVGSATRRS
jgi:hypothetical protein